MAKIKLRHEKVCQGRNTQQLVVGSVSNAEAMQGIGFPNQDCCRPLGKGPVPYVANGQAMLFGSPVPFSLSRKTNAAHIQFPIFFFFADTFLSFFPFRGDK